jgi:hypothetical protein
MGGGSAKDQHPSVQRNSKAKLANVFLGFDAKPVTGIKRELTRILRIGRHGGVVANKG